MPPIELARSLCYNYSCSLIRHNPLLPLTSPSLTSSQPHSLSILLQLGDQAIPLLHHICVLFVLVVRSVGFDDLVDTVNSAGDAVRRDKFGQVTEIVSA